MENLYYTFHYPDAVSLNEQLSQHYQTLVDTDSVRKTHFFGGRYENIYIDRDEIAEILPLIEFWLASAAEVLGESVDGLRCGFWFNEMHPSHVTLPHSHDDDDEKLSGVYYLKVPEKSGDLILHDGDELVTIQPEEGKLVLFSASNVHEVTENKSREMRLSIGMNYGSPRNEDAV